MNSQTQNNIQADLGKLDAIETQAVVQYISQLLQKRFSKPKDASAAGDDLIGALADAYENKRARAVVEWERTRRQYVQRAA